MNNSLFNVIFNAIKVRFIAITSRLRMWLNPSFIKTRIFGRIRQFFTDLFNVKPKDKYDYYKIFGWMVSKRLAFAIVIVCGSLSLCFLWATNRDLFERSRTGNVKTFYYNEIPLRFHSGEVQIKARRGYVAYKGQVKSGGCNGHGTLYNEEGGIVYQGAFVNNMYEGQGTSYHMNGAKAYTGTFYRNLFEGEGKQYRSSGSILYEGMFSRGMKEGDGKLYDETASAIYTGKFSSDNVLYSELLGKTATEVRTMYTGSRDIYRNNDTGNSFVHMNQIGAIYRGVLDEESTSEEVTVTDVYVLSDQFRMGDNTMKTVRDVTEALGAPSYQGSSRVEPGEALAINIMNDRSDSEVLHGPVDMEENTVFSDYTEFYNIDGTYQVYIYSYENAGLVYTFVCRDVDGEFAFYSITSMGDASAVDGEDGSDSQTESGDNATSAGDLGTED